jgi:hypothetical protein
MRISSSFKITWLALFLLVAFQSCKKQEIAIPPSQAHFTNKSSGSFFITAPNATYAVPIGVTNVSSQDRTITVSVSSPTGAQSGVHYNLNKTTVVIPAGKALDSIMVTGVFSQYTSGRKDSLVFTIQESGASPSDYNNRFVLLMRGPCFINDIVNDLEDLLGDYTNTNELWGTDAYGPYTTTVTKAVLTSPTTANITVANIFDWDWGPAVFTLNWSNLANPIITLQPQPVGGNAGNIFGGTYNGMPYALTPASGGQVGSFDFCNQRITLRMNIGISTPGGILTVPDLYTVTMVR